MSVFLFQTANESLSDGFKTPTEEFYECVSIILLKITYRDQELSSQ